MFGVKNGFYKNLQTKIVTTIVPEIAQNLPISKEKVISQLSKTGNTKFEFKNIKVNLDDNLFIPKISTLNDLRRSALSNLENMVKEQYTFNDAISEEELHNIKFNYKKPTNKKIGISLLLNDLTISNDLLNLKNVDNLYLPYRFFLNPKYSNFVKEITQKFKTYIYMPNIIRDNFEKNAQENIKNIVFKFNIAGAVISHLSQIEFFKDLKLDLIGNYNLNIFNTFSALELKKLGLLRYSISPELNKTEIQNLTDYTDFKQELIVYGKTPLMTNNYCYLGSSNKCYPKCDKKCLNNEKYYLKDRMNFKFRIVPDNTCTLTTIYNSKTTSITYENLNLDFVRIDILDEQPSEIQNIIDLVKQNKRFEGKEFTSGRIK